jgi:hypothetical protein
MSALCMRLRARGRSGLGKAPSSSRDGEIDVKFSEKTFPAAHTVATVLWVVGLGLILAEYLTGLELHPLGLWVAGLGGCLTLRAAIWSAEERLESRECAAFELGHDLAQQRKNVRNLPTK